MNLRRISLVASLASLLSLSSVVWSQVPTPAEDPVYATVNGQTISVSKFQSAYANYLRQTYYHRQVPEGELAGALITVKNQMFDRILLLDEAKKRGLKPDDQAIAIIVAEYDTRYATSDRWKENRDTLLVGIKQQLAEQSVMDQIEKIGRTIAEPTDDEVLKYYQANPELFTEPEKLHLHTILLKVDPSSSSAVWAAARVEAARIITQIKAGAKFEELASLHSNDGSAEKGGDMGYLHKGMIPDLVQAKIEETKLGELTPPIDVLEGIALFRLDDRLTAKLHPIEKVSPRAKELLKRELVEKSWENFKISLRGAAKIELTEAALSIKPVNNQ